MSRQKSCRRIPYIIADALQIASTSWQKAHAGVAVGYRNAQISCIAPTGTRPLLMHSGSLLHATSPLARELARYHEKSGKSAADHQRISELEFRGALWRVDGRPGLPARTVEAALREAAARRGVAGRTARAAVVVADDAPLDFEGSKSVDELAQDPRHQLRSTVVQDGVRRVRTRPLFPTWSAKVRVAYNPELITRADLIDWLILAGDSVGVGDGRPRYGQFAVVPTDAQEST